jgi:beta-N-acetylhexosaminidase
MSVRDDVGQLLWIGFPGPVAEPALLGKLARGEVGATILFKRNLVYANDVCDFDALVELNRTLHVSAPDGTPALIAVDQEGGVVARVRAPATVWPPMIHAGELAEQVGRAIGDELRALGFDIDFAPVLDVNTNPDNPIIGDRAFATEPEAAARHALAFARGLHAAGMLSCGKHFPGHGDTSTDSHLELPRIDHHWDRLEAVELLPFKRAAEAKLPMIMTAHVVFAALDPTRPATLSPQVVTGLLREKLGYQGVIVSDDLDMKAIAAHMGADVAAVAAIRAGCDVLLLCRDEAHQDAAQRALIKEGERDASFAALLGVAAARVRAMKKLPRAAPKGREVVGAHRALADQISGLPVTR